MMKRAWIMPKDKFHDQTVTDDNDGDPLDNQQQQLRFQAIKHCYWKKLPDQKRPQPQY